MLSTHVVILRTSTLNTVYNDGYMRRQRLAVMCEVVPVWLRYINLFGIDFDRFFTFALDDNVDLHRTYSFNVDSNHLVP